MHILTQELTLVFNVLMREDGFLPFCLVVAIISVCQFGEINTEIACTPITKVAVHSVLCTCKCYFNNSCYRNANSTTRAHRVKPKLYLGSQAKPVPSGALLLLLLLLVSVYLYITLYTDSFTYLIVCIK